MEKHLSPEEVAEKLSVQPDSVRIWLRNGSLKGIKLGRLWRVPETEIKRFLEAQSTSLQLEPAAI
jgi:excisionase family DNA binding protein